MNPIPQPKSALKQPRRHALAHATFITALLAGGHALAADDADTLHVVEVKGKSVSEQDARMAASVSSKALPSAVTEITLEEIAGINIGRDMSNLFRRVPGVVANNIDQGDTGNGFRMRGFATQGTHGADTAVYVDGVPQNIPSSQGGAGHGPVFLEWLTPDMVGGVEVIKGPVSALYGDQNRAGAVKISTRSGGSATPSSLAAGVESNGGRRLSLVVSNSFGQVDSLLVADRYRADSFRDQAHTNRDNLFWKLSTRIGDGIYSARLSYYKSDFTAAGYLLLPSLEAGLDPHSVQFNLPGFGDAKRTSLVLNRAPASGEAGWYATAYAEQFERTRGITTSAALHTVGSDDRDIQGGRIAHNWTFGDQATLMVGADVRRDDGDALRRQYRERQPTANYINNQNLDLLTYGVFAQGQYKLLPSLKLHTGLRYDRFDYDLVNRKLPAASTDYTGSVFTPKLGLSWSLAPELDLFANVAQGFRSPAAEQISSSGSLGPLGASGGLINTGIAPSKVKSYDLGFNSTPLKAWTVSGAVYYTTNEDEIVNTAPDVYQSTGETLRKGYEIDTRYQFSGAVSAYASYGRIIDAYARNPLPGVGARLSVPAHQYKAGAQYRDRLGDGTLSLNADIYITRDNPYYMGTPSRVAMMPTYVRYDLKGSYDIGKYQASVFTILQPQRFASDIAYGTTAGLLTSPMPQTQVGASLRYFF